jgi:hypothetical protein
LPLSVKDNTTNCAAAVAALTENPGSLESPPSFLPDWCTARALYGRICGKDELDHQIA